jgi:hypothetical protein
LVCLGVGMLAVGGIDGIRTPLVQAAWMVRYAVYDDDLYAGLRSGRGTRENPMTIEDVVPILHYCGRTGHVGGVCR